MTLSWIRNALRAACFIAALLAVGVLPVAAQAPPAAPADPPASTPPQDDDPDLDPSLTQPDFALATLATNLRLPRHKVAFRLTHRFGRPLAAGDFGDLAGDLFGFDAGARIGFEFRYGLISGGQIGLYRTSNRTIELFGQYELANQKKLPLGISAIISIEGTDNFTERFSPGVQLVFSREIGDRLALYLEPAFVGNTNDDDPTTSDNNTAMAGVGGRLRILGSTYLFVETTPRFAGYTPGGNLVSFGIEKRAGGHIFQLNFSDGLATTLSQIAQGNNSSGYSDWYIGFNLSRKFY